MTFYPVHLEVERPARYTRVQLFVRLAASMALGVLHLSLGTLFAAGYLLLPVYAASRMASLGSADAYARNDGPRVMRVLHWFTAVSAWGALVVETLPAQSPEETVRVTLDPTALRASPVSALLRVFTGALSALVLGALGCLGAFVWLWAAVTVLVRESVGESAFAYLLGLQRWGLRLLAYQACLVEQYPPFSFSDGAPVASTREQRIVPT